MIKCEIKREIREKTENLDYLVKSSIDSEQYYEKQIEACNEDINNLRQRRIIFENTPTGKLEILKNNFRKEVDRILKNFVVESGSDVRVIIEF